MLRYLCNRGLLAIQRRYDYDVDYMQEILQTDLPAFLRFMGFQTMSAHQGGLPANVYYAAKLRAIIWDDCGPCTQLVVNMALEAGVPVADVRAVVNRDFESLSHEQVLVVRFTEFVLAHDLQADELREELLTLWGRRGLIAIGYAISSSRVYPALKYSLGYGKACTCLQIADVSVAPHRTSSASLEVDHA